MKIVFIYIHILLLLSACGGEYYSRPMGYNRIDLPQPEYRELAEDFPYQFEYSKYAKALKDSSFNAEPFWMVLYYPTFDAEVNFTYKDLKGNEKMLRDLIEDSRKLLSKHEVKASSIKESIFKNEYSVKIDIFELEGEVPSQLQFYATDSIQHFLRGALYFKTATKNDSLKPVIQFIRNDMVQLFKTLQWKTTLKE